MIVDCMVEWDCHLVYSSILMDTVQLGSAGHRIRSSKMGMGISLVHLHTLEYDGGWSLLCSEGGHRLAARSRARLCSAKDSCLRMMVCTVSHLRPIHNRDKEPRPKLETRNASWSG